MCSYSWIALYIRYNLLIKKYIGVQNIVTSIPNLTNQGIGLIILILKIYD